MWNADGGLIACGEIGPDVPLDNIRAMYEDFREYGRLRPISAPRRDVRPVA